VAATAAVVAASGTRATWKAPGLNTAFIAAVWLA
jgi:hypothetical protein